MNAILSGCNMCTSQQDRKSINDLLADLKACSRARNLERGRRMHSEALQCGHSSIYVVNALMNMYVKCGSMVDAHQVFDSIKGPTVVSWTILILGYTDNGQGFTALDLFTMMRVKGHAPNSVTFVAALKACTYLAGKGVAECRNRGKALLNLASENGCDAVNHVQSTLIDMYTKCGSTLDARQIFDNMKHPDVISWTALILGYAENGQGDIALQLFAGGSVCAPDHVSFVAALKACISIALKGTSYCAECKNRGEAIHNFAVENGFAGHIYVQSAVIDMYAKCRSMIEARRVFDDMCRPNVVSWNVLILGYADNGEVNNALDLFTTMRTEGPAPDSITFVAALKACGLIGSLEFGRRIHSQIGKALDVILLTSLVDFYAKCGSLDEAQSVFDLHAERRNITTWNALLTGFSSCGDNETVFSLFERMLDSGCRPDGITFLCILTCCSHAGLVEKGKECFDSMSTKFGIVPTVQHYTSMIDLFGRADKVDDAMALLELMPCRPDDVTWKSILGACRKWKNIEIGRLASQSLVHLTEK